MSQSKRLDWYEGRLFEFDRIKNEQPADPCYWDMHERRGIVESIEHAKAQSAKEVMPNGNNQTISDVPGAGASGENTQPAACPECRRLTALNNELTAELGLEVAAFENLQAECRRLGEALQEISAVAENPEGAGFLDAVAQLRTCEDLAEAALAPEAPEVKK